MSTGAAAWRHRRIRGRILTCRAPAVRLQRMCVSPLRGREVAAHLRHVFAAPSHDGPERVGRRKRSLQNQNFQFVYQFALGMVRPGREKARANEGAAWRAAPARTSSRLLLRGTATCMVFALVDSVRCRPLARLLLRGGGAGETAGQILEGARLRAWVEHESWEAEWDKTAGYDIRRAASCNITGAERRPSPAPEDDEIVVPGKLFSSPIAAIRDAGADTRLFIQSGRYCWDTDAEGGDLACVTARLHVRGKWCWACCKRAIYAPPPPPPAGL